MATTIRDSIMSIIKGLLKVDEMEQSGVPTKYLQKNFMLKLDDGTSINLAGLDDYVWRAVEDV